MKKLLLSALLAENDFTHLQQLAAQFAQHIQPGAVIYLQGNLGAGKTTFCQTLLKTLHVTDHVTSPTFTLVNEYRNGAEIIYHWDLYRLHDKEELFDVGIEEYFTPDAINIIEWPEKGAGILPGADFLVTCDFAPVGREVKIFQLFVA